MQCCLLVMLQAASKHYPMIFNESDGAKQARRHCDAPFMVFPVSYWSLQQHFSRHAMQIDAKEDIGHLGANIYKAARAAMAPRARQARLEPILAPTPVAGTGA